METTDSLIIQAMRTQPDQGFRLLMGHYKEPVYWHIRRLVVAHEDAQDATQETFLRIFRSFSQFRNDASLKAWIYRIATHEALRIIGSRHEETVRLEMDEASSQLAIADSYTDFSDLEAVKLQHAIHTLPRKQQIVFNLRYYDEWPYADIAAATQSTLSAVKANFHLAKEKICRYMTEHD